MLLGGDPSTAVEMRLVRKYDRPFLLLPSGARTAARTLALYPAQTFRARLARQALRQALRLGFLFGGERFPVSVSPSSLFVRFLSKQVSNSAGPDAAATVPPFGVLAGNPNAAGQRFIFLVFDASSRPAAVLKVGVTDEAKKLIRREKGFLSDAPDIRAIPRLRDVFESPAAEALAMDYMEGESPRENAERKLPQVLTSWIRSAAPVPTSETRVWKELQQCCGALPLFAELANALKDKTVNPVVFHGDFAPWNIRVSADDNWTVFDWERGDQNGLPGYDWFHYLIQTRVLVAHKSTEALIGQLEQLFSSPEFQRYAGLTRIAGAERPLVMAYLLHHNEVIRPGEGLTEGKELLAALIDRRWVR